MNDTSILAILSNFALPLTLLLLFLWLFRESGIKTKEAIKQSHARSDQLIELQKETNAILRQLLSEMTKRT